MMINITLDPGHGNKYNGGIIKGFYEGANNFKLATYIKNELETYKDVKVFMTKTDVNQDPSLPDRGQAAIKNNSKLFISIHSDAFYNSGAHGVTVFYSMKRPNSKTLGQKIGNAVVECMKASTGTTYLRGVQIKKGTNNPNADYFGVIRNAVASGNVEDVFLIEHGFHTNLKECTFLNEDSLLKKLAIAEVTAIAQHYGLIKKEVPKPDPTPVAGTIEVNDIVKIKQGAKTYDGKTPASFVYNNNYVVSSLKGARAVLDAKGINTPFNTKDLILVTDINKPSTPVVTPPTTTIAFKVGDKVKVKSGAKTYTGGNVSSFVYNNIYSISSIKGDRAVLDSKGINTPFNTKDLTLATSTTNNNATTKPVVDNTIKVGSKVKVKSGAKSYEGKKVASFIYNNVYTVDELKGKRAVLNKKGICTAFNIKDLIKQ